MKNRRIATVAGNAAVPSPGFTKTDLLVVVASLSVLAVLASSVVARSVANSHLQVCLDNLRQVNGAVLQYAQENGSRTPSVTNSPLPGGWWWYKEKVKQYVGLTGKSSANDKVFACPDDRIYGHETATAFCRSAKHNFTSYVYNGVDLPDMPNIAGREISSIVEPARTLLVMEWVAHPPLSWHRSRTGRKNTPFYNDAECVVGFVDGNVALTKMYYDGLNAAYTRDPAPGYAYKYSGD